MDVTEDLFYFNDWFFLRLELMMKENRYHAPLQKHPEWVMEDDRSMGCSREERNIILLTINITISSQEILVDVLYGADLL